MGSKLKFVSLFFIMFVIVTAIFSIIFMYEYTLFFSSAIPPTINQFYGNVTLANGSQAEGILEIKYNGTVLASSQIENGQYGYNPLVVVENIEENSNLEFYVNSIKVKEKNFINFGLVELNLILIACGDGVCSSGESCSSCSQDCGKCSSGDNHGSGGGGGGGGGSYIVSNNSTSLNTPLTGANNINNVLKKDNSINSANKSSITGFAIADEILNGRFYPVIAILFFLLIIVIILILEFRRKHLIEIRKEKVYEPARS